RLFTGNYRENREFGRGLGCIRPQKSERSQHLRTKIPCSVEQGKIARKGGKASVGSGTVDRQTGTRAEAACPEGMASSSAWPGLAPARIPDARVELPPKGLALF